MVKPQQPELRRSGYGATTDDSAKSKAENPPVTDGGTDPVPEANQPGHHPDQEQDQPDPEAFVHRAGRGPDREEDPSPPTGVDGRRYPGRD